METNKEFQELHELVKKVKLGGGESRIENQHKKGKLTARERIKCLTDPESFIESQAFVKGRANELGMDKKRFSGDGVVTGTAMIDGKQVYMSSQDFTVLGGSLGEMHAEKISFVQKLALSNGTPFIQINDSGGARIQEGILSLDGYAKIFRNNVKSSGVIPQLSVILGPCAGGAVYSPAITDFIFMVDKLSHMYITGPAVIKAVTGEEISHEELGGANAHCSTSGVSHFKFSSEEECFLFIHKLLSYLPSNNLELPPVSKTEDLPNRETPEIMNILPVDPKKPYDVKDIIMSVIDRDSFLEVHKDYAQNVVVGFAKLNGRTVGIFANQPKIFAAVLDINSSDKAARFIRFCDAFNIPIISLVDVPGFLPGVSQEHGGIIRHGAKLLFAIAEATVPKISLIIRKSYGGSMIAMSSKSLGYDRVMAFPTAEVAVMGAEGAANIIFRTEINESDNPDEKRKEKIEDFKKEFMNPYVAAEYGFIDDIIDPKYSRVELIRSLEMNICKKEDSPLKKHGNIPL
jgi:methylmalonyl-CoA decarboxylase subunit alpha